MGVEHFRFGAVRGFFKTFGVFDRWSLNSFI